jgi:nitroreductase
MKINLILLFVALFAFGKLNGQPTGNLVTETILTGISEREYTTVPVTDQQIDLILKCGIKAPSAMNNQPWRFTVIKDDETMKSIINTVVPGNVLIVVSGLETNGTTPDFDCGLAAQSMFIAAHSLGLGARMYGSPTRNMAPRREQYQIPAGYKPVIVLRIGNIAKAVDAVSSASPRKPDSEIVNYLSK